MVRDIGKNNLRCPWQCQVFGLVAWHLLSTKILHSTGLTEKYVPFYQILNSINLFTFEHHTVSGSLGLRLFVFATRVSA